ncbi:mechanosensitive ion channel domain-containing protein [Sulfurimonas sp. HSL-1716]|uniref:mechanosensitive ion channel family protein n=1 Tax=Hydrocurvibacter sulfurireducens TaxID=3131937 RepID=UPI0031F904D4
MRLKIFGSAAVLLLACNSLFAQSAHESVLSTEVKNLAVSFMSILMKPIFTINNVEVSSLKIFVSVLVFVFGFFVGGYYKVHIQRINAKKHSISSSTKTILANLGYYTILIISFLIALNIIGINLSSIALVAGALSVGIGFGLQNIVSNFVSGLILMFERSVKVGDYVELSETLRGHIVDIRMRSTVLNTNANIDVIVPNQNFIQNSVINWTMNDNIKRFDIPFGVAYGTRAQLVMDVVLKAVEDAAFNDVYITDEKRTRVIMTGMGNSSVNFELMVWIQGENIFRPRRTTSRFLVLIYEALYANGIEIPFPQLDLHIKNNAKED